MAGRWNIIEAWLEAFIETKIERKPGQNEKERNEKITIKQKQKKRLK